MTAKPGIFTISLDFELFWGIRDCRTIESYFDNLNGTSNAIKAMLSLFEKKGVHVTWSCVGFLFAKDHEQALASAPETFPSYRDHMLSPYDYLKSKGPEKHPEFHFAPDLIDLIRNTPGQFIGTHTFSHYYTKENGQTVEQFAADIEAAKAISPDDQIESIVFPRNQHGTDYLAALTELGITSYRGNEDSWLFESSSSAEQGSLKRAMRLMDSYVNLSGHHTTSLSDLTEQPYNIPASRLLRPYSRKLSFLETLKVWRVKRSMKHAAKNGEIFHLWWHPHNFGKDLNKNMAMLSNVVNYYLKLQDKYGMQTLSMEEVSKLADEQK